MVRGQSLQRRTSQSSETANAGASVRALSKSLEKSLKHGHYDLALLDQAKQLDKMIEILPSALRTADNREYLKNKGLVSEILDYFGRFDEANESLRGMALQVLERVDRRRKAATQITETASLKLAREQVRLCLEYAQTFYRQHHYGDAERIIKNCSQVVENGVVDEMNFPCYGTRARISYYLGRVLRQTNKYDEAESCFAESIRYHYQRAKKTLLKHHNKANAKPVREELDYARHKSAICLALGLGWLSYTKGALARAKSYLMPARVLLLSLDDAINSAYVQLILGAIERCLAGRDKEKLGTAIDLLEGPCKTFETFGHLPYRARAIFELSLAHLYAGDLTLAGEGRKKVQAYSEEKGDVRWCCNALILESRIRRERALSASGAEARQNLRDSEEIASQAFQKADKMGDTQLLCKIDALIARGEARIQAGDFENARKDLSDASKINRETDSAKPLNRSADSTNPKIEAVCNLHLARSYIKERKAREAAVHLQRWKEVREQVEHVSVHDLGAGVERDFMKLRTPFVIEPGGSNLKYKKHRADLFAWLMREAEFHTARKKEQDQLLGTTRETRRQNKTRGVKKAPKAAQGPSQSKR